MTRSATKAGTVSTTHTIFVAAPPRVVYDLLADAARWPLIFSTTLHVEKMESGATGERLRWWAVANGAIRNWTTRRAFDPDGLRIRFHQETPLPPVASMAGEWVLVPLPGNGTSVVLLHEFRAIGDDPANTARIKQAVDRNSTAELAELKAAAELGEQLPHLVRSFADSVLVDAGIGEVYDFLYRVDDWPGRLPHVSRVILDEAVPNVQTVEMQTRVGDGAPTTARMVRVCSPHHSIVYKQLEPPDILSAHLGGWYLHPTADGVRVTAHNTVMIRPMEAFGGPAVPAQRSGFGHTSSGFGARAPQPGLGGRLRSVGGMGGSGAGGGMRFGATRQPGPGDRIADHRFAGAVERAVEQVRQLLREHCLAVLAHAKTLAAENPGQRSLRDNRLPSTALRAS
jgi:aromatase